MDENPFCVSLNKVDGIFKICNGIRYLELSNSYDETY